MPKKEGKQEKKRKIVFKYIIPDELRDCFVNGAYGGVTQRGEIYACFYFERPALPKKTIHDVLEWSDEGETVITFAAKGEHEFGGDVVRHIQSSIVMDISTAIRIRKWLDERIEIATKLNEELKQQKESNKNG